jgi:hypothetical protein
MKAWAQVMIAIAMAAGMLVSGNLVPPLQADETTELVPIPRVDEFHGFNITPPGFQELVYEQWYLAIHHGDVMTLLQAKREGESFNTSGMDYEMNIHYTIADVLYIAQFMIVNVNFVTRGEMFSCPLYCDDFELTHTPVSYIGAVPHFYCNMTYQGIEVYHGKAVDSKVDLTICHRIVCDWNRTDIKVEAIFDFNNTRFVDANGTEYEAGEPFAAEVAYTMALGCPGVVDGPLTPTSYSNTTLEYNMTQENGAPLTVSKLKMLEDFTVHNASGESASTAYSWLEHHTQTLVIHGFPDLTYKDTEWIHSDPELTVFHDRAEEWEEDQGGITLFRYVDPLMFAAVIAILVVAVVSLVLWKRKKRTV